MFDSVHITGALYWLRGESWGGDSVIKNSCYSCRGLRLGRLCQHVQRWLHMEHGIHKGEILKLIEYELKAKPRKLS